MIQPPVYYSQRMTLGRRSALVCRTGMMIGAQYGVNWGVSQFGGSVACVQIYKQALEAQLVFSLYQQCFGAPTILT
jgi:hypothetical protein